MLFQIGYTQNISLLEQFNGHIDFTMVGNTLNPFENENSQPSCAIFTNSSATLNLNPNDFVETAYLYWAGSGTGDFDVRLNEQNISAQRTFESDYFGYSFFSAFADITNQIQNTGNGNYTLSDLDLTAVIPTYCNAGINFGGWAIVIVYSNNSLPINQINIYDGMQSVPSNITINLDNLNVIDNIGAKIGFLAWEGDSALAVNESLRVNGDLIGNTLNPVTNAFNGTNSFTGATDLYNMDLDFYNIENNINIGDTSAVIELTSGQDYVMVNCVVTKLNSQLSDATIAINSQHVLDCVERVLELDFTVFNSPLATGALTPNVPISVYADGVLLTIFFTQNEILIGEFENFIEEIALPITVSNNAIITIVVDDDGTGNGIIIEAIETNNTDEIQIQIPSRPLFNQPDNLLACNEGFEQATFNLEQLIPQIISSPILEVAFFTTIENANLDENEIPNTGEYVNSSNPQEIFIRITDPITNCYSTTSFWLEIENCPINIPNGFSPNGDGINDTFTIFRLQNIFTNYQIIIFNRYGNTVYKGSNSAAPWNGKHKGKEMPVGTYYYLLNLNDNFFESYRGWIYLMR